MTDEEIAGALWEAGILCRIETPAGFEYRHFAQSNHVHFRAETVLADWRVAGTCLERMRQQGLEILVVARTGDMTEIVVTEIAIGPGYGETTDKQIANTADESAPRAICEAFANTVSEGRK